MIIDMIWDNPRTRIITLVIVAILVPNTFPYPLGYALIAVYALSRSHVIDTDYKIGFTLTGRGNVKYSILYLCIIGFGINILLASLSLGMKFELASMSSFDIELIYQIEFAALAGWEPSEAIYEALFHGHVSGILIQSIRPLFYLIILAPVFESILIFSMLLSTLLRYTRPTMGIIITALFFALLHLPQAGPVSIIPILIGAPVHAWLFVKTKSIYPTIFFHAGWNFTIYFQQCLYNLGFLPPHM